ncbi:hypothetical protein [Mesorhizobium sp. M8A.F.Ca.ET.021.01.1.1]|uniref:hypothetical protein n=1 Tax=Mesorhizobium sp. M8A.F.Ca.ET.021.01.1.1 TaxID=2496757 RepID=UPI000FCAC466|nr:hypothetical protein [Mesorhizobium sp. M8A.F.Ca.ET.021.01.1.1]RUW56707.1 hypothetical protein EOA36_02665 [Mesorhizobium sp. M8A.F.Ca.ET.021.01.1.1]
MVKRTDITYLSPADLEAAGLLIYGANWRAAMAEHMGVDPSLIWRYMTLKTLVPRSFAVAVEALATIKRHNLPLPTVTPSSGPLEPIARAYERRS